MPHHRKTTAAAAATSPQPHSAYPHSAYTLSAAAAIAVFCRDGLLWIYWLFLCIN